MRYLILILSAPALAIASTHHHDPTSSLPPHFYVGGKMGWGHFQDACTQAATDCDNNTLGMGIYAGYQLNRWFSIDVGINDYGELKANYSNGEASADVQTLAVSTRWTYPIDLNWSAFTRLGASYQKIEKSSAWKSAQKSDKWQPIASAGVSYRLSQNWSIQGEYQFIDGIGESNIGKSDLHFTSLGLTYHFGQASQEKLSTKEKNFPPQKSTTKVSTLSYFDFDSATLRIDGELEKLTYDLNKSLDGQVIIIGHTDNKGAKEYNQKLSEKRAQAVADYLIENQIKLNQLTLSGEGESKPIADNETAQGRAKNRRVEIHANIIRDIKE